MGTARRRTKQLGLRLKPKCGWGGARKGAGRKRTAPMRRVGHRRRTALDENQAVHVTWRVLPHVLNLRSHRSFRELLRGFVSAADRFGTRITRFSVQGNHIHMIVETEGTTALARAMQGLGVRIARALNKLAGTSGTVFADRYHARPLSSPREAWNAIRYVMRNHYLHAQRQNRPAFAGPDSYAVGPENLADPRALWRYLGAAAPPIARPVGWLLRQGWQRGAGRDAIATAGSRAS